MKEKRNFPAFIFSLCALAFALFFQPAYAQEAERTVINIENAQNTRYEKDKQTGNDIIILSGNVKVSVSKGSNKNVITADVIRYDRVTEMIYADGSVSLEQTTATSGSQNVTANALMFNTSTLEGVFDDGRVVQTKSDAINLPSGSTLIVASDIFGRSESNTIAFKDGVLTFCDDEDPHWNIKASRIWLLPGGEFAFLNALLFVGPVPVFYFPAFYYPKDELIFNPVFGYRKREGYFIQTTAYIYGRKPLDTTSSSSSSSSTESDGSEKLKALFNFVKPSSLKEQRVEGLMLHNLDADYNGNTSNYFKIMGDYYSNLGVMVGLDGVIKPPKYVTNLEFGAQLGFSNTIFREGTDYLPYGKSGEKYYDKSNLFGFSLPFRYSTNFKMSMSKPFSLSLSLPIYSDPFFKDDFSDRTETMDWISYLIDSANDTDEDDTINEVSSFSWTLTSSYSVPIPDFIKPVISSFSLSLNSSIAFSTMTTTDFSTSGIEDADLSSWKSYSPQRKFYYPSQITPATLSGTLSGTIVNYSSTKTKTAKSVQTPAYAVPLALPEEFLSDKEKSDSETASESSDSVEDVENQSSSALAFDEASLQEEKNIFLNSEPLPKLSAVSDSSSSVPGIDFSMKYSVKPSISTQLAYSSSNLKKADDFEWDNLKSSMYTIKVPVTLDNSFSYAGSFFNVSNSYTFNPVFQKHPYISDNTDKGGYTASQITSLKKTDYSAEKRDLTNTNSISLKPFCYIPSIKDTGITWRSTIKLVRTEFLADEYDAEEDNPEWKYHWVDWDDENAVTTNAIDLTFAANQMDSKFSQSLTLSTTLKPQAEAYYGTLKFGFPYTSLAFEAGIKKSSTADDADWVKQPFKQSFTLSLFSNTLKFSESYNYNMEESYHDSMKLSLGWKSLSAAYTMSYTYGYDFSDGSKEGEKRGWTQRAEKEFLPYSLSLSYSPSTKTVYTWKNRISMGLGLSTSVVADLLKPTSSYFTFSPSVSFKIHEFLTVTFSSTSRNSVIYRYFGNDIGLAGEENIFVDLFNSFRFDDESLRQASGFKLKSLKFDVTHELHDWDFKMSFKMEPRLVTEDGKKSYDFSPYITISILWRPMSAMKTEIIDDYGEWKLQ